MLWRPLLARLRLVCEFVGIFKLQPLPVKNNNHLSLNLKSVMGLITANNGHLHPNSNVRDVAKELTMEVYKLEGIKAPNSRQKCKKGSLPWLCGAAAKRFLSQTTHGIILTCKTKSAGSVKCNIRGRDLANIIVKAGWAVPISKEQFLKEAELYARENGLGLWTGKK